MSARATWKLIQAVLGTTQDGIPGKNDENALEELRDAALAEYRAAKVAPIPTQPPVDARSEKNIATLLPEAQPLARALVHLAQTHGVEIKIIDGSRTYEEQAAIYAKGRTAPGKIVTNARPGYSNHNFGIAFDIGVFEGATYIPESPLYDKVGALGKTLGLAWGGDWKTLVDKPHFEYNPKGYTIAQMRARKAAGQPIV